MIHRRRPDENGSPNTMFSRRLSMTFFHLDHRGLRGKLKTTKIIVFWLDSGIFRVYIRGERQYGELGVVFF